MQYNIRPFYSSLVVFLLMEIYDSSLGVNSVVWDCHLLGEWYSRDFNEWMRFSIAPGYLILRVTSVVCRVKELKITDKIHMECTPRHHKNPGRLVLNGHKNIWKIGRKHKLYQFICFQQSLSQFFLVSNSLTYSLFNVLSISHHLIKWRLLVS